MAGRPPRGPSPTKAGGSVTTTPAKALGCSGAPTPASVALEPGPTAQEALRTPKQRGQAWASRRGTILAAGNLSRTGSLTLSRRQSLRVPLGRRHTTASTSAAPRAPTPAVTALSNDERRWATSAYEEFRRDGGELTTARDLTRFLATLVGYIEEAQVQEYLRGLECESSAATIPLSSVLEVLGKAKRAHRKNRQAVVERAVGADVAELDESAATRRKLFTSLSDDGVASREAIADAFRGCNLLIDIEAILDEEIPPASFSSASEMSHPPRLGTVDFACFNRIYDRIEAEATSASQGGTGGDEAEMDTTEAVDVMNDSDDCEESAVDRMLRAPRRRRSSTTGAKPQPVGESAAEREAREAKERAERAQRRRNATRILGADGLTTIERRKLRRSIAVNVPKSELYGTMHLFRRSSALPPDPFVEMVRNMPPIEELAARSERARAEREARENATRSQRRSIYDMSSAGKERLQASTSMTVSGYYSPVASMRRQPSAVTPGPGDNAVENTGASMRRPVISFAFPPLQPPRAASVEPSPKLQTAKSGVHFDFAEVSQEATESQDSGRGAVAFAQAGSWMRAGPATESPTAATRRLMPCSGKGSRPTGIEVVESKRTVTLANHDRGTLRILKMPQLRRLPSDGHGSLQGPDFGERLSPSVEWSTSYSTFKDRAVADSADP